MYNSTIKPIKILLIVVGGIGKVAPITQYSYHHFARIHDSTNYRLASTGLPVEVGEKPFMAEVFTSSSKRYASLAEQFIREADGILLAYSVTNRNALRQVIDQYETIERVRNKGDTRRSSCQCCRVSPMPLLMVGIDSRSNLPRMVSKRRGSSLAVQLGIEFVEIKETWNSPVETLFYQIVRAIDTYARQAGDFDEFHQCPRVTAAQRFGATVSSWMKLVFRKLKVAMRPCRRKAQEANINRLCDAIIDNQQETVRRLIYSGVDVNSFDQSGSTPLHIAAALNRVEIAKLLLQNGASGNQVSPLTGTALTVAASRGNDEIVKILLQYDAGVDMPCDYYENMLRAAARRDNPHILRHLNKRMSWNPYSTRRQ
ncbi:unnamed protein product [Clonostachys rosea]|uniref:Uncharacterized protein n=1 Tax=Bionectria ochroleuca TaxID=29856 RepID=A0ABY6UCV8_BIOOC|nr:unnamed protein product [Clonostachys rosea]